MTMIKSQDIRVGDTITTHGDSYKVRSVRVKGRNYVQVECWDVKKQRKTGLRINYDHQVERS